MEENKNNNSIHKFNTVIFVILFLIAILFEIYWFVNYPDDIFLIVGIGVIAIIMGFFAFEGLMDEYMTVQKQRYEQNEMLIKTQKALYLATKKNSAMLETKSEQNIEAIKYLVVKMSENQQQMTNLIKENNEEVAKRIETSGSDFSSADITQLVEKLNKTNERLTKEVQAAVTVNELVKSNAELVKNVKEVLNQSASNMRTVSAEWAETEAQFTAPAYTEPAPEPVYEASKPVYEEQPEPVEEYQEPIAQEMVHEYEEPIEEPVAEVVPVYEEPQEEVTEAYSYIEEEAVAGAEELDTEMDIEESANSAEVLEEVEIAGETVSEEVTEEKVPFEVPKDNGGMLSEEEIAALFANL